MMFGKAETKVLHGLSKKMHLSQAAAIMQLQYLIQIFKLLAEQIKMEKIMIYGRAVKKIIKSGLNLFMEHFQAARIIQLQKQAPKYKSSEDQIKKIIDVIQSNHSKFNK